jgi:hypothetical protein
MKMKMKMKMSGEVIVGMFDCELPFASVDTVIYAKVIARPSVLPGPG